MAGKMCTGATTNNSYLLKEQKAFSEGIYYRAGGTLLGRPSSANPHASGSSAYTAWLAGWTAADSKAPASAMTQSQAPCVAIPTNTIVDT